MNSPFKSIVLAALVATSAILAFAPTAEAQASKSSLTMSLSAPQEPVRPLQNPLILSGQTNFQGDPGQYQFLIGIPIQYTVSKAPAWATVTVSPSSDVIPIPPTPGATISVTRTFQVFVTATAQAPAFTQDTIEITVNQQAPTGGTAASAKQSVPVFASYFGLLDVQLIEAIKVERPQTAVIFPVKVSNFGNGETKVTIEPIDPPASLQVAIPVPVTLQSKQTGGNVISADVPLTIQTPYKNGYLNEVGTVNYKITSSYALDSTKKGDDSAVSVVLTTRGFYVPGVSPIVFVALLGAVALLFRRQ